MYRSCQVKMKVVVPCAASLPPPASPTLLSSNGVKRQLCSCHFPLFHSARLTTLPTTTTTGKTSRSVACRQERATSCFDRRNWRCQRGRVTESISGRSLSTERRLCLFTFLLVYATTMAAASLARAQSLDQFCKSVNQPCMHSYYAPFCLFSRLYTLSPPSEAYTVGSIILTEFNCGGKMPSS